LTTPTWKPVEKIVSSITNADPGVVTTTTNHGYSTGAIVRFFFPADFGMMELIGGYYVILVLSPTTFSISADTRNFTPFSVSTTLQAPQVLAFGEVANTLRNAEANTLSPTLI